MKKAKGIRVLCVDDHPIVREGIAAVIATQDDIVAVGEAGDGQTAVAQYRQLKPDVVVMDLRMPGTGGVEATIQIRKEFPTARIIVLTTYEGDEDIHRALEAGAQGYMLNIAEDTVKIHIKNIFGKMRVIDRTQAVVSASERGIIRLDQAQ